MGEFFWDPTGAVPSHVPPAGPLGAAERFFHASTMLITALRPRFLASRFRRNPSL